MIEIAKRPIDQYEAEGFVTIDYTDPVTQKVKERISGKNHVFKEALFCHGDASGWQGRGNSITEPCLLLTDDASAIDPDFPFLVGKTIGYGYGKLGSSGTLRGAWNPAGYIAQMSTTAWESKYIYDFTPSQALGTIRTIGLTGQYCGPISGYFEKYHPSAFSLRTYGQNFATYMGYNYATISSAGVVSVTGAFTGTTTNIDKSAVVGNNTSDYKVVGYDETTGECYILVQSATSTRRFLYKFSDITFSTLLATFTTSAMTLNNSSNMSFYVYQGKAIICYSSGVFYSWDFTANTVQVSLADNTTDFPQISLALGGSTVNGCNRYLSMQMGKYVISLGYDRVQDKPVFDIQTGMMCGRIATRGYNNNEGMNAAYLHPLASTKLPWGNRFDNASVPGVQMSSGQGFAYTRYLVPEDAPERPAGYGMTITYELKVNW